MPSNAIPTPDDASTRPTIVLVHGAWADSSSWGRVIDRLRAGGSPVVAVANPLQGLTSDTDYLSAALAAIDGPIVLVGHSYGGALISNVDATAFDLRALVYVAGFIPQAGETVGELAGQSTPPLPLVPTEVPDGVEVIIDPAAFPAAFAGDLDDTSAARLAIVQRPANTRAVSEAATQEAYRVVPSWVIVTRDDQAINPELQRRMAYRTGGPIVEVDASHAVMVSRPDVVVDVIAQAAHRADARVHA
jgi:pimeloyl-ACP methyl ester carboxylesterase